MNPSKRNQALDALRAISVVLVVLAHSGFNLIPGGLGVTIFFVISGFIITKLIVSEIERTGDFKIGAFYLRRFWKIFPPFLFIVVLPSIITWQFNELSIKRIISQIFFYFNWDKIFNGSKGVLPGSQVVWSLSIEEQFYIVVAALTYGIVRTNIKRLKALLLGVFTFFWIISFMLRIYFSVISTIPQIHDETGNMARIYLGTDTRMSAICSGAMLALLAENNSFKRSLTHLTFNRIFLIGLTIPTLIFSSLVWRQENFRDTLRFSLQELATCLAILLLVVLGRIPKILKVFISLRIVQIIGVASYCIYLSHLILIIFILGQINQSNSESSWIFRISLTIIALTVGTVLYTIADRPFEKFRARSRR